MNKPNNLLSDTQNIIKKSITSGNSVDGYELSLSGRGYVSFRLNKGASGNTYRLNSTTDYPLNGSEWMHIAATFDGTTMKLYINGVQEGGDLPGPISGIASNTLPVGIGAMPNGRYSFQGLLDDARIYNQALTEQEIMALLLNPPSEPYLIAPSDIAVDVNTTPTLEWEASATADTYQVQISTQPDFSTIVYDQSGITTTSTTVTPELLNSTTYY